MSESKDHRLDYILEEREKGKTLREIGEVLGITRERVRQIYEASDPDEEWGAVRKREIEKRRERERNRVRGYCKWCNKPLTRETTGGRTAYCCDEHRELYQSVDWDQIWICDNCGTGYHPWRSVDNPSWHKKNTHKFCSLDCYDEFRGADSNPECADCGTKDKSPYSKRCQPCHIKTLNG